MVAGAAPAHPSFGMARAALFDVDGTLVDSVDLHAQAWHEALARFGKEVDYGAIRAQIGKGGDQLLPVFLSEEEQERFGEELEDHRASLYQRRYLPFAKPFPEARELLVRLKQSGTLVGLASSCRRTELGYYLRMVGGAKLVDAATASDDVDRSKPFPDVFEACLERLGLDPADAVAVGDSPFDAESAGRAGLATVGVLCGGFEERVLRAAGCVAVYADPAELLARLPQTPLAPEPHAGHQR
jgi:HAD superfamily hydrolase (TIGR01509 family)